MIRPSFVSIAIPLWVALNLVSVQAQSPLGTLHGVTANADGTPIASAPVVIHRADDDTDLTVISGFDGAFSVSNLKPGRYEVKASKGELHSSSATVDLAAQQDLKVDLALAPGTAPAADISPAVAKKLEAMEAMEARMAARIEQLEAELKSKSAAEQPATPALRGDLVATLTKDPSQIPIVPATLAKPDTSKAVASAAGSSSSGQDSASQPVSAPAAPPAVDLQTPFAYGDFTWLNGSPRNKDVVMTRRSSLRKSGSTRTTWRISISRTTIRSLGRPRASGPAKSRSSRPASAATSTGRTFVAESCSWMGCLPLPRRATTPARRRARPGNTAESANGISRRL